MNRDGERRIYVQMAPDTAGLEALSAISSRLPAQSSGRVLPREELHVTLIHFGRVKDMLASLRNVIAITNEAYEAALKVYLEATASLMTKDAYHLEPRGYARFGARGTTLVGRYEPSPGLVERWRLAYDQLLLFVEACGITNPVDFVAHDQNLKFAGTFTPHITFYKGYDGPDPHDPLPPLAVTFMPLEY